MKTFTPLPLVASIGIILGGGISTTLAKAPKAELSVLTSIRTVPSRLKVDENGNPILDSKKRKQFNRDASFIVAHDAATQRVLITNAITNAIDVIDVSNLSALELGDAPVLKLEPNTPAQPSPYVRLDTSSYGAQPLSVASYNGIIAVAMQAGTTGKPTKTLPGKVVFFDSNLQPIRTITVGAFPDMLTFSPDGRYLLVANEGEPHDYTKPENDPEGSITIIDLIDGIENATERTADFRHLNGEEDRMRLKGVRIFGPKAGTTNPLERASASVDLEPEWIAVSQDSKTAWITLQENNALAILDIESGRITDVKALGEKDHSKLNNGLDPSSADKAINIRQLPVYGLYQPDSIASYRVRGKDYLVIANEGDGRAWGTFSDEATVKNLQALDPDSFKNWDVTSTEGANALKDPKNLGDLKVATFASWFKDPTDGVVKVSNPSATGHQKLYAFGARSFSVCDAAGKIIWDSGDEFEKRTEKAAKNPLGLKLHFNASHDSNDVESRSPSKGPEPEGITVGKAFGRTYAFIALERVGGIMVYDISEPLKPEFVRYINQRDFTKDVFSDAAGDLGPEGLAFISEENSPNGKPLLVVGHEFSGTTTIFEINPAK